MNTTKNCQAHLPSLPCGIEDRDLLPFSNTWHLHVHQDIEMPETKKQRATFGPH